MALVTGHLGDSGHLSVIEIICPGLDPGWEPEFAWDSCSNGESKTVIRFNGSDDVLRASRAAAGSGCRPRSWPGSLRPAWRPPYCLTRHKPWQGRNRTIRYWARARGPA